MNNELLAVIRLYLQENINLQEKKKKLSKKQKVIAQVAEPEDEITGADFKALRKKKNESLEDVIEEYINLQEKKKSGKLSKYQKSKYKFSGNDERSKAQKAINRDTEKGKKPSVRKMNAKVAAEKEAAAKNPDHGKIKNPYSEKIGIKPKKENLSRNELRFLLESIIENELDERKKRRKKSKKRKSKSSKKKKTLSKKTMDTLKRKAKASGYTAGSLASEYRRGLGAYYSSGSRKGMGPHQWAMARVNSAIGKGNPSWANLKRSKAKKK